MSIERKHSNARMSQIVVAGETVYLAGQVAREASGKSVTEQAEEILGRIDTLLAEAGTDKTRIVQAQIWLTDIGTFNEFNAVWEGWVAADAKPVRACVEAKLASPDLTVEVMVVAHR